MGYRERMKPVLRASAHFEWVQGSDDPEVAHRLAHDTAWALLDRVRHVADSRLVERVISVADTDAIDDIAELWADASEQSLAGMLWRLYLIRQVVRTHPEETTTLFRAGFEHAKSIDPVVVGLAAPAQPESMRALTDEILRGVFSADLANALERASAFCNLMSLGCAAEADSRENFDSSHATELTTRALRYSMFANELGAGARLWRAGRLH